jgi:CBS domain-containing protein
MEQIGSNDSEKANFKARTVKDIIKHAKGIPNKASVRTALDEMRELAADWSPVANERGELLGTLSRREMNRKVGGLGHDPETEPVEAHIERNGLYCFKDQTIEEAERIMLEAKVDEVPVVTGEKVLLGVINIEAIAQEKRAEKRQGP